MNVYIGSPDPNGPKITISLIADPAREDWRSEGYQHDLRRAVHALQAGGVQIGIAVDVHKGTDSGSLLSGSFTIAIDTLSDSGRTVIGTWVQRSYGRKVRIKASDIEVEASTAEEVERLFEKIRSFSISYDDKV